MTIGFFTGFEDLSMEELRLQAYEAQKQGATNTYVSVYSLNKKALQ